MSVLIYVDGLLVTDSKIVNIELTKEYGIIKLSLLLSEKDWPEAQIITSIEAVVFSDDGLLKNRLSWDGRSWIPKQLHADPTSQKAREFLLD